MPVTAYMSTKYSFEGHLEHGICWDLKRLGGAQDGKTYAPPEVRGEGASGVKDWYLLATNA